MANVLTYPAGGYYPSQYSFQPAPPNVAPATIAASGTYLSGVLAITGYPRVLIACQLTQAGSISVQLYSDAAGAVAVGNPITTTMAANAQGVITVLPPSTFRSFQVTITNTGGSTATVTNFTMAATAG